MLTESTPELTLRQKAYEIIQGKLLNGELRVGDLVSELALAKDIGMSRTPVREAIGQLEIEGLFDKVPRVGTRVRLPNQRELAEMYGVREALESFVTSIAVNALTGKQFAELEACQSALLELVAGMEAENLEILDAPRLSRFFEVDITFHSVIIGTTDNRHILKITNEFRVVQRVFEYGRMAYDMALVSSAAHEHGEILAAIKNGDNNRARSAMAFHIRSSCEHAMKHFEIADRSLKSAQVLMLNGNGDKTIRPHSRLKQKPRRNTTVSQITV